MVLLITVHGLIKDKGRKLIELLGNDIFSSHQEDEVEDDGRRTFEWETEGISHNLKINFVRKTVAYSC